MVIFPLEPTKDQEVPDIDTSFFHARIHQEISRIWEIQSDFMVTDNSPEMKG
jgi:hypothetical protein